MKKPKTKKKSKPRSQRKSQTSSVEAQSPAEETSVAVPQQAVQKKTVAEKKAPAKTAVAKNGGLVVWYEKTAQFFREVKVELKKVTWPSRKETLTTTTVVVALVLVCAIFLGLVDLGLSRLIRTLIG